MGRSGGGELEDTAKREGTGQGGGIWRWVRDGRWWLGRFEADLRKVVEGEEVQRCALCRERIWRIQYGANMVYIERYYGVQFAPSLFALHFFLFG